MKCLDFREMIDSYLSDELLTETNHDVLRHMENCADCRNVVQARREVRQRLKQAVTNSPQYQIGKNFTHNLQTQLKHVALESSESKATSWFNLKSLTAITAGLLITFALGFVFINNSGDSSELVTEANKYTVQTLPAKHIVNIASGDHEHCAIRHKLDEAPISLVKASAKYEGIEKVVTKPLENTLSNYQLVEAHACKYKETRFAHMVLQNQKETVSVLITDVDNSERLKDTGILNFSSNKYQIARFDVKKKAVFVVSALDKQTNSQTAKVLMQPLRSHFADKEIIQTALLMFY